MTTEAIFYFLDFAGGLGTQSLDHSCHFPPRERRRDVFSHSSLPELHSLQGPRVNLRLRYYHRRARLQEDEIFHNYNTRVVFHAKCLLEQPTSSPALLYLDSVITPTLATVSKTVSTFQETSNAVRFGFEMIFVALFAIEQIAHILAWSGSLRLFPSGTCMCNPGDRDYHDVIVC